jgi:hypothetical protein
MKNRILELFVCMILIGACFVVTLGNVSADQEGDYLYSVTNEKATITDYTGAGGEIIIPSTLGGYKTVAIGYKAFYYSTGIISVVIPDSITTIGYQAFYSCTSLTSVNIPDSVTSIGNNAFYYCSSLTSVDIGNNVTTIGEQAFYSCTSLTSVTLGNKVISIGNSAFAYCSALDSIDIPDSVTTIGYDAFSYCSSLTNVNIGDSVTSIGYTTFAYCSSLTNVTIGKKVTAIGDSAFAYCSALSSIVIPNKVTTIGDNAFYYCYSLNNVTIGSSVAIIGERVFFSCPLLTYIEFVGVDAPTKVKSNWIEGVPNEIRGHAYNDSDFPPPGSVWNGLIMGAMLIRIIVDLNKLPIADFTWKPSSPVQNQEIIFDASWSYDSDGSITSYEWDWNNDGIYDENHTTLTAINSWSKEGSYPVTLKVSDNASAISTKTITVTVGGESGAPGFEMIFVLCAIVIAILVWKKKSKA